MRFNLKMSGIKGFSLVELSIVLTIVGLTLSGAIELATRKTEAEKIKETNARMDAIEQALQLFVINNQRLPCPGEAMAKNYDLTYGLEAAPSAGGCSGTDFVSGNVYEGAVPTISLGLADKYMADDWDRRFTYAVDYRFVNNKSVTNTSCNGTTSTICFKQTSAGSITIKDSTGASITTEAVYVLISHGKNGYGAWKYNGGATRLAASSDTDEKDNAGNDAGLFDATFVQKDNTATFDDIVRYSTKAFIIDSVAGITDSTTCTAASDSASQNGAGSDPCQGSTSTVSCYALAAAANNFCLQP